MPCDEPLLDERDRTILDHPRQRGRRAGTNLADALDASDDPARRRKTDMEGRGSTRWYSVNLDLLWVTDGLVSRRVEFGVMFTE